MISLNSTIIIMILKSKGRMIKIHLQVKLQDIPSYLIYPHRTLEPVRKKVAIHANDITGRPRSVRPCNTDLEESNIGCGPVSIGASAPLVRKAPLVRTNCTKPYVRLRTAVSDTGMAIPVWRLQPCK